MFALAPVFAMPTALSLHQDSAIMQYLLSNAE